MSRRRRDSGSFASFTGLFDAFSNGAAGWSLRKLRSAYTGNCIRVRRSSDNAEQDIGFIANVLDELALTNFVGAGEGYVVTWYDQSTNGYDVTNTTQANQPNIVTSGTVNSKNGKPCVTFDGGSITKSLARNSAIPELNNSNSFSFFNVTNNRVAGVVGLIWGTDDTTTISVRMAKDSRVSTNRNAVVATTTGVFYVNLSTAYNNINQVITTGVLTGANLSAYDNGNYGGAISYTGNYGNNDFHMGFSHLGLGALDGNIQEVVMFSEDKTTSQSSIEGDINNYYGVF